ncbi:WD40-repeat-containing domain protein [Polychytrium aggregatum]|uniref:WD40-repeat-containing domain protein n=1 Tax=Polychytrium aggregatum TaxID=110093 RepID=UPI0022FF0ADA|nr:WD40-repeat-containing domain protein [Polychytrium aggregatum]KAI9209908.1 WD40-repeat-containing domain protein [Polychytrium aggregatum]
MTASDRSAATASQASTAGVSLELASVACNRVSQGMDCSLMGTAAYAAHHMVAVFDSEDASHRGVHQTLRGHTDRVNCVRFIRSGKGLNQRDIGLVSGSFDKTARIWRPNSSGKWVCTATLSGHTSTIVCVATTRGEDLPEDASLIATGSLDGTIRVWELKLDVGLQDTVECIQVIETGTKYPIALALSFLPNSSVPVIISGGTDNKLGVYIRSGAQFSKMLTLPGHTDWVRSVDIAVYTDQHENHSLSKHFNKGDLMVASASQDKYIRIWKISDTVSQTGAATEETVADDFTRDLLDAIANVEMSDSFGGGMQLSTKAHLVDIQVEEHRRKRYTIMFDALLLGHEDWVHSVAWAPPKSGPDGSYTQPLSLLSASADKSLMLWTPDPDTGVWNNDVRVGEIGGSPLGFLGAVFGAQGERILGHGYNGAIHEWISTRRGSRTEWAPDIGLGGHSGIVEGVSWDPTGRFVVSVSTDQTARLFAAWSRPSDQASQENVRTWHEVARPQIHGYDLNCIAFINNHSFVSGADEKVVRIFEAPRTFIQSIGAITRDARPEDRPEDRPIGANVPALGLSNKAVFVEDVENSTASHDYRNLSSYTAVSSTPTSLLEVLSQPPLEQHLTQHTLWPEVNKIYGHAFEIIAVAASHDGRLIASACKASKPEHAVVRLISTSTWKEVCSPLAAHTLTVTAIRFSPGDKRILTAGRDRMISVFELRDGEYKLKYSNPKSHARIVWAASWSADGIYFATASRDKSIKIWTAVKDSYECVSTLKFEEAVTAVDFVPAKFADGSYILGAGLENGAIGFVKLQADGAAVTAKIQLAPADITHIASIKSLAWSPVSSQGDAPVWTLCSCSDDSTVRIFSVDPDRIF